MGGLTASADKNRWCEWAGVTDGLGHIALRKAILRTEKAELKMANIDKGNGAMFPCKIDPILH